MKPAMFKSINIHDDVGHPARFSHYHPTSRSVPLISAVLGHKATMVIASYGSGKSLSAGVGTLAMASQGVKMVHVDASKKSVEAAKGNALLSGLADAPVRWMVDDAVKFTAREVRRGRRYDGILLDPPKYGRGPTGEVWKLEEGLPGLIADCRQLLDAESRFLFLTVYAVRMSALAIGELLRQTLGDLGGTIEAGELAVREEARGLLLPTAIWARWSR